MDPRVRNLYKRLLWIGRDYPQGYEYFKTRLHKSFMKNKDLKNEDLDKALEKGEFVYKEMEALIFLTRYRVMKRRYY